MKNEELAPYRSDVVAMEHQIRSLTSALEEEREERKSLQRKLHERNVETAKAIAVAILPFLGVLGTVEAIVYAAGASLLIGGLITSSILITIGLFVLASKYLDW